MRRQAIALLVTGAAAVLLAGCGGHALRTPRGAISGALFSVPLIEYHQQRAIAAFVGLMLGGHLYDFLVDTGAARTIIDARVARKLGLRDDGSPSEAAPLGCKVSAQPVALRSWHLGDTSLPASLVFTARLLRPRGFPAAFAGMLGSDVLSRFGTVTIDFNNRRLILRGRTSRGGRAVPVTVLRRAGNVLATTQVDFDGHHARFVIDTGAAISLIDSTAAPQLGLPVVGPGTSLTGAVCRVAVSPVLVSGWGIAGLHIPEAVIGRTSDAVPNSYLNNGIIGIIGSSTLARRGTLTIDYVHATMILGGTGG